MSESRVSSGESIATGSKIPLPSSPVTARASGNNHERVGERILQGRARWEGDEMVEAVWLWRRSEWVVARASLVFPGSSESGRRARARARAGRRVRLGWVGLLVWKVNAAP